MTAKANEESMTPKLTEEEKDVARMAYWSCQFDFPGSVFDAVEAVLAIRDDFARGRESGIREALEAVTDEEGERPFHGVDAILAARLARLLPAKEPTPEQRVEAILMRHKFRQDACEYVAAEIVADLDRERS